MVWKCGGKGRFYINNIRQSKKFLENPKKPSFAMFFKDVFLSAHLIQLWKRFLDVFIIIKLDIKQLNYRYFCLFWVWSSLIFKSSKVFTVYLSRKMVLLTWWIVDFRLQTIKFFHLWWWNSCVVYLRGDPEKNR